MEMFARDKLTERSPEPEFEEDSPDLVFHKDGWAIGERVIRIPSRKGWYYRALRTKSGLPDGIVHHFTAVDADHQTNRRMAIRRRDRTRKSFLPRKPGSWHFSVADTGEIIQQLPLRRGAFHAGSGSARRLPYGWANFVAASIEWGGYGTRWPEAMIESGIWLFCGLVKFCKIPEENAFSKHSWIDPGRKDDPGLLFVDQVEPRLRLAAYGG